MAENKNGKLASSSPRAARSPDSDVSPRSQAGPKEGGEYFDASNPNTIQEPKGNPTGGQDTRLRLDVVPSSSASTAPSTTTSASLAGRDDSIDSRRPSYQDSDRQGVLSRKSSTASVQFRPPRNPSLPQGKPRKTDNRRLRESSPSPVKFRPHVGFDNLPAGEATKNNTSSFTLHVRHQGYQPSRRSRTFMVGVDEHAYSDYALVWLLNNMVDDGDEVICVRVLENPPRGNEKAYQDEARRLMETIQAKNEQNKAISIILEYSVGKLHATFQQLLHIYQPSMLVVGTKGRSLGGIQGLVNTRNSFSKYCLQYSPVPVVVVRPDDKRAKKKEKRTQDPSRHSYAAMLAHNAGKHEADSEVASVFELEKAISADEEAHHVATAIGLPAAFDPTIKPFHGHLTQRHQSPSSDAQRSASPAAATTTTQNDSGDEESGDDEDEYEIEAVSAQQVSRQSEKQAGMEREQKARLHAMEVGEAKALLKSAKDDEVEEDDDDDESQGRSGDKT